VYRSSAALTRTIGKVVTTTSARKVLRVPLFTHGSDDSIQDWFVATSTNKSRFRSVACRAKYFTTRSLKVSSIWVALLAASAEYMFRVEGAVVHGDYVR
jgi:hypothetical protein